MESHESEELKKFEELAAKARAEQAPEVDVRLLVRAALLTQPRRELEMDWMDVMTRLFSLPKLRMAMTASFLAVALAALSVLSLPTDKASATQPVQDPVMAYLIDG